MYRKTLRIMLLAWFVSPLAHADPIHAIVDGAYWHHGSDWVFPAGTGLYQRVGVPQDVAGSEDAEAHYAYVEDGVRYVARIDVYRSSSPAAAEYEAVPEGQSSKEGAFLVNEAKGLYGIRRIYDHQVLYMVTTGEWRVTIRISGSRLEAMDDFVRGQRWETLAH